MAPPLHPAVPHPLLMVNPVISLALSAQVTRIVC
jgi:hypothetical protein